MNVSSLVIIFHICVLHLSIVPIQCLDPSNDQCSADTDLLQYFDRGKRLISRHVFQKEDKYSLRRCIKACLIQKKCGEITYHEQNLVCELARNTSEVSTTADQYYVTSSRESWSTNLDHLAGGCRNNPCSEIEMCIHLTSGQVHCLGASGNLAVGKPSTQSSTFESESATYSASQANNGDHIARAWGHGDSCAHTDTDASPWWKVDLGYTCNISRVSILTRGHWTQYYEGQTANILVGVGVSDDVQFQECGRSTTDWTGYFQDYTCTPCPIPGRFVKVSRWSDNGAFLVLCEVEVFAVPVV